MNTVPGAWTGLPAVACHSVGQSNAKSAENGNKNLFRHL